jgi:heavy metal translocating P-type ATPase
MRGRQEGLSSLELPPLVAAALAAAGVGAGIALHVAGLTTAANWAWGAATALVLVPLGLGTIRQLLARRPGVDLIALLAMAGALGLGEYLAGAVVALMLSGGQTLEERAGSRARRELSALVQRVPQTVHRYESGKLALQRGVDEVRAGDVLLVQSGEVVPVDGLVVTEALVDESALTGEAVPQHRGAGDAVRSGTVNAGGPFDLRATAPAAESTYAGILRLVRQAQASKSPFVRMADRYALAFVPLALALAFVAWAVSGDPVRALAVLVVATPCPLILAAPIAMVGGISRAANRGIIVKGGGALEAPGRARRLLIDKTGTLTAGMPVLSDMEVDGTIADDELLRLAASLDQVSFHVFAAAIVAAARQRGLALSFPSEASERPGRGIEGIVDGHRVRLGNRPWVFPAGAPASLRRASRRVGVEGLSAVYVSVDTAAGILTLEDPIRPDTQRTIRALRLAGFQDVVVVTGDQTEIGETVGAAIGADRVLSQRSPEEKVDAVRAERRAGTTVMVGDGINDAAALAEADVGVAMGARGASAHSEAADVVLLVDRLDALVEAVEISRRSYRIALQSVIAGMALSVVAMGFAAAGLLAPVAGALVQEGIDVAVILNALRSLSPGRGKRASGDPASAELAERLRQEHRVLIPELERLRVVARQLDELPAAQAREALHGLYGFLTETLAPHEAEDDRLLYPLVAGLLGGDDPTGTMSRGHEEIRRLIRRFSVLVQELPDVDLTPDDVADLRGLLYGLYAVLRLHFAQEDETYLSLRRLQPTEHANRSHGPVLAGRTGSPQRRAGGHAEDRSEPPNPAQGVR